MEFLLWMGLLEHFAKKRSEFFEIQENAKPGACFCRFCVYEKVFKRSDIGRAKYEKSLFFQLLNSYKIVNSPLKKGLLLEVK